MSAAAQLMVYGATGYTAGLIIESLVRLGPTPILCGRRPVELEALARRLSLESRVASLSDPGSLAAALEGVNVLVNAAGPFVRTADPIIRACIRARTHYLDISGEVDAIEGAARHDDEARRAGVMILPGTGFDVVPSDCLCAHVVRRLPATRRLRVGISGLELLSRGSMMTLSTELGRLTRVRREGVLREIEPGSLKRSFDFGGGPKPCTAVSWGDLATAFYSTGVGDIETYFESTAPVLAVVGVNRSFGWLYRLPLVQQGIERQATLWGRNPTLEERRAGRAYVAVEGEDGTGRTARACLSTPEAYSLTAETASTLAKRVLDGEFEPGFQTPSRLFGPDFILRFDGVSRVDLESPS